MNLNAYSIFDSAVGAFGTPVFVQNDIVAKRSCLGAMNTDVYGMFPEQFTLFRIGEFDPDTGGLISCPPVSVINFAALKAQSVVSKPVVSSETLHFEE